MEGLCQLMQTIVSGSSEIEVISFTLAEYEAVTRAKYNEETSALGEAGLYQPTVL